MHIWGTHPIPSESEILEVEISDLDLVLTSHLGDPDAR